MRAWVNQRLAEGGAGGGWEGDVWKEVDGEAEAGGEGAGGSLRGSFGAGRREFGHQGEEVEREANL